MAGHSGPAPDQAAIMLQVPSSTPDHVVVIGAGMGGLAAALSLSARGMPVTIVEAADQVGGKMRQVHLPSSALGIDAGPTVFTMKWVFDGLFDEAGLAFDDAVALDRADVLARHAWPDGSTLDLFADIERSAAAISQWSSPEEAQRFEGFCAQAAEIYNTLEESFLRSSKPGMLSLHKRMGFAKWPALLRAGPFSKMWAVLGKHFQDPRLQQLFGRYATYCGSSPFLCPATLMLVAHVEQQGVWYVDGGMHALAQALADAMLAQGGTIRTGTRAARIETDSDGVTGVTLCSGEHLRARHVIYNGDVSALGWGLLGNDMKAVAEPVARADRSLSACAWTMATKTDGFPLLRHNVFFSGESSNAAPDSAQDAASNATPANRFNYGTTYAREFDRIFRDGRTPDQPTVYVCAQDRTDQPTTMDGPERLLILTNAPANGDTPHWTDEEAHRCQERTISHLERLGLKLNLDDTNTVLTTPADFATLFPGSGGALYGRANHSWDASFQRPDNRTRIRGLYLAGGSVHPGPGVPMAALSGRLAAQSLHQDLTSTRRSHPVVISGGMSTD
jgi:1-hydroxycarotenoid 3,4-desaturase